MNNQTPSYRGYRFPSAIISHAVWLYHRFCLSFREVEELLAERGISVTYETIRQWLYGQKIRTFSFEVVSGLQGCGHVTQFGLFLSTFHTGEVLEIVEIVSIMPRPSFVS